MSGKMWRLVFLVLISILAFDLAYAAGGVRNGSLNQPQKHKPDEEGVVAAKKAGWKLPDDLTWPAGWGPNRATPNGVLRFLPTGGMKGDGAINISIGHIGSSFGKLEQGRPYIATIRVKGKGGLWYGAYLYGSKGFIRGLPIIEREVDTDKWVEYKAIFPNDIPEAEVLTPVLSGKEGNTIIIDEVTFAPAAPIDVEMVGEENKLYGKGALIENLEVGVIQADEAFAARLAGYRKAVGDFRAKKSAIDEALFESAEKKIAELEPYVAGGGIKTIQRDYVNDMIVLTRVLERLAGRKVGAPVPLVFKEAAPVDVSNQLPGVRHPRPGMVTITDIRSDKVRYDENEQATTTATLVSKAEAAVSGKLTARMILDLDTVREIAGVAFTIAPGEEKKWSFSYNVGPETYGRAIEVSFTDDKGKVIDSYQEYYAVAREFFRVQQHTHDGAFNNLYKVTLWTTYYNQVHIFASEPTDFGVQCTDLERFVSGGGRVTSVVNRRGRIECERRKGINHTFYQNWAFSGQMGYQEMRKHPEYVLYDESGQFAVDPIYGGYPNPMELASPMEIGPKRKVLKPYLDRRYNNWQHCLANLAVEDAVIYNANCIKKYARKYDFAGVYVDGNMGVQKGYSFDGRLNVPSDRPEDYAALGARNHRIFSEILKSDNPYFGTWFNWGHDASGHGIPRGVTTHIGSGTGGPLDVNDESVRAATAWKNVMLLNEIGSFLQRKDGPLSTPKGFLDNLIKQRDFAVQKYGASTLIGYSFYEWDREKPGPSKWGWPSFNYLFSQVLATQIHYAGGPFLPSYRPCFQFMERYSRFIWAPDVRVVAEAEETVQVDSSEELWWKRLVYKLKRDDGYDLIVHLLRIPPTEKWDMNWVDEPVPLAGVKITADIGTAKLLTAQACRPYHFEEEQQVVQKTLEGSSDTGKVSVEVPPFRYHTMVVFRVEEK